MTDISDTYSRIPLGVLTCLGNGGSGMDKTDKTLQHCVGVRLSVDIKKFSECPILSVLSSRQGFHSPVVFHLDSN